MFLKKIFLIGLSSLLALSADLKFVKDPEALCLDGTQGSYYLQLGSVNKWLIWFEGGSWIGGANIESAKLSAKSRSQGDLGSSKNKKQTADMSGIFGRNSSTNKEFYNWNYIFMNYCDGTGFQGYAKDPIVVNGTKVYFKGEMIVKAILRQHLNAIVNAETVLISGSSSGGLAALTWTQYIRELLPEMIKVFCAPDSGIFLDFLPYDGSQSFKDTFIMNIMQLVNVESDPPNKKCVVNNLNEKWKCLFAQYLVQYIDVPIFFVQSLYDYFSINIILKLKCAEDGTLIKCGDQKTLYIEQHHSIVKLIMEGRIDESKYDGAFAISCLQTGFLEGLFNSGGFAVPGLSGNTISKTMSEWINNPNSTKDAHIDQVNWPDNKKCNLLNLEIMASFGDYED